MKKMILFLIFLGSSLWGSIFEIDKSHSKINFKIKHMAISYTYGTFDLYNAVIDYNIKLKTFQNISAKIDVNSINTNHIKRDRHLKSNDFFDTKTYPNIFFKLLSVHKNRAIAQLTIKNITKKITLTLQDNGTVKDSKGNIKLGFSLETKINRKEFGLTWNKLLETGSFIIGDMVIITVDIEAKKID